MKYPGLWRRDWRTHQRAGQTGHSHCNNYRPSCSSPTGSNRERRGLCMSLLYAHIPPDLLVGRYWYDKYTRDKVIIPGKVGLQLQERRCNEKKSSWRVSVAIYDDLNCGSTCVLRMRVMQRWWIYLEMWLVLFVDWGPKACCFFKGTIVSVGEINSTRLGTGITFNT